MDDIERLGKLLRIALLPVFGFALLSAVMSWGCAWIFYERYEFSGTLLALGCVGIVIAWCSYLYLLTSYTRHLRKF